jgi:hypothetical protein
MASTIIGWILIGLGVISYVSGLAGYLKERFFPTTERALLPAGYNEDLKIIAELVDKVAALLEKFSNLSVPMQWALLGLVSIGIGSYLIATKPF